MVPPVGSCPTKKGWIRHGHFSPASYPAIVSFEQSTLRWLIASIARAVWSVNHIYCTFAHQMYTLPCYRPPDSSSILFISAVTGAVPFQELPAGKRFDAEHNMLFLLAALADIQHIIIILYITPFQIMAALPVQAAAAVAQNSNFFIGQHNAYPPPFYFEQSLFLIPACPFVLSNRSYSAQRLQWQLPGPR